LGTEGYSPAVLHKVVRQGGKVSFAEASQDLQALGGLKISPTHVQRLTQRVGREWAGLRDRDVAAFRDGRLAVACRNKHQAAAVMLDGGRLQVRADDAGRGVSDPAWRESKVAAVESLHSRVQTEDPRPQPPRRLLDRQQVARLAAELRAARGGGPAADRPTGQRPKRRRRRRDERRPRKRMRTVVATLADSEAFGWQVAAEVQRRGLHRAARKACVCDGQKYNWSIWSMHLVMLGFIPVLDFLHLAVYLYAAACAAEGKGAEAAWVLYESWLRLAWSGEVAGLLRGLKAVGRRVGVPPAGVKEDDRRKVVWDAIGYVTNNRDKMDYPRYRKLGLPVSSAGVESTIKQMNRRIKGSEKFWLQGGGEAVLQVRAAYLSEDGRAERYWAEPRPRGRAVGAGRLGRQPS
jgi:hypothetical protein